MPDDRVTEAQRRQVAERAHSCCEYCRSQARYATQRFSAEHIRPRAHDGQNTLDNLALACQGCNNHKYQKVVAPDPASGQLVRLYHPRQDRWGAHFVWSDDCSLIIGITPVGRATVAALQLNRAGVVNLRHVLYAIGEHPPPTPEDEAQL
ncbi:HNH endonuclease [Chloroflexales bacterium ZM16-3]|nr:HNH endonuclease [Chloroflexales bacterium ZM16-3]